MIGHLAAHYVPRSNRLTGANSSSSSQAGTSPQNVEASLENRSISVVSSSNPPDSLKSLVLSSEEAVQPGLCQRLKQCLTKFTNKLVNMKLNHANLTNEDKKLPKSEVMKIIEPAISEPKSMHDALSFIEKHKDESFSSQFISDLGIYKVILDNITFLLKIKEEPKRNLWVFNFLYKNDMEIHDPYPAVVEKVIQQIHEHKAYLLDQILLVPDEEKSIYEKMHRQMEAYEMHLDNSYRSVR